MSLTAINQVLKGKAKINLLHLADRVSLKKTTLATAGYGRFYYINLLNNAQVNLNYEKRLSKNVYSITHNAVKYFTTSIENSMHL